MIIRENTLRHPARLMNRNFLLLWQGQAISQMGSQISSITMLFWLKHTTESPALMGLLSMLSGLVTVLLGPVGGAVADRNSRRSIIIICDLISGLAVISLSLFMWLTPTAQEWNIAWVFTGSILLSAVNSFFRPAISASTADLVPKEKVTSANSMLQASIQISTLVGRGVGGILFRLLGAPLVLLIDGATYLFSAFSECFMTIPQTLAGRNGDWRARAREFKREIWDGIGYVGANAGLTQLLLIATCLNFFMAPILGLFPFYVEDHLKLHPDWFGYLLAIYGAGHLAGYLLAGIVTVPGRTRAGLFLALMLSESVLYGLLGVAQTPVTVATVIIGCGATSGFMNVNLLTILQVTTPSDIRGRVFGLLATISACLLPIGMGLAGAAASLIGKKISLIYIFCGASMAVVTLVASLLSELTRYLAYEPNDLPGAISFGQRVVADTIQEDHSHV